MSETEIVLQDTLYSLTRSSAAGWTSQQDVDEARAEVEAALEALRAGRRTDGLRALFLPTGALQEISIDNGWGDDFLGLADRFDQALTAGS